MFTLPSVGLQSTLGRPFKLISEKGTLLGVLTVPHYVADMLAVREIVQFVIDPPVCFTRSFFDEAIPPPHVVHEGLIVRTARAEFRQDGVQIYGVSLEELEKVPGWSFSPSAAYLRSLITE
jgi:hypothetical protein